MLNIQDRPQWYSIPGGSYNYIEPLIKPFKDQIHLNTPIESIDYTQEKPSISFKNQNLIFDKVIIATHSDQALKLLSHPSESITKTLSTFPYQDNQVTVHTDRSVMPNKALSWAAWNFKILNHQDTLNRVSYYMNELQCLSHFQDFFVSLNMEPFIDPDQIIASYCYQHPVFTSNSLDVQKNPDNRHIDQKIYFCGAYWGFGFHEDGLNSGLLVSKLIDKDCLCKIPFAWEPSVTSV